MTRHAIVLLSTLLLAGCAIRLGGASPEEYRTLALSVDAAATAAQVAERIRETGPDVVLMSAPRDSAFFAEVATLAGLTLSGPGDAGATRLAFLAGEAVGDTTLALPLEEGGELWVHDALYEVDDDRFLDLLALRIEDPARVRDAVRALLRYVATDVMHQAATIIAVEAPDAAVADSVSRLLQPAFFAVGPCVPEGSRPAELSPTMRLFYGPEARISCESARVLEGADQALLAELVILR